MRMSRLAGAVSLAAVIACTAPGAASAQVPENIYQEMLKIGQIVDPACTAKLYRPLMPANDYNSNVPKLYPGVTIERDVKFGAHDLDLIDIFTADNRGSGKTVVIYIPGGGGNKIEQQNREANAFYDNIGRWATKNDMVGILMQRHPGQNWDDPAKDVAALITWVQTNIARYGGNPDSVIAWAQSAGNGPLGTYVGRPELYTAKGVGLKGAIYMSGGFNIYPLQPQAQGGIGAQAPNAPPAGSTCGSGGPGSTDGRIEGPSGAPPAPARAGGAGRGGPGGPGGRGGGRGQVDEATLAARSTLEGYKAVSTKLFFVSAELDPGIAGKMSDFYQTLHDELCKLGQDKCPTMLFARRHNHMSEVFSIDTADTSVSGPILEWIRKVK